MNCEQRYNNALKRARIGLHDCNLLDCDNMTRKAVITTIYHLFPELAEDEDEDEDERIRKGIIRNLQYLMDRSEGFVKEDLQERIAWLEKQGEFKSSKWTEGDVVRHGGVLALVTNGRKAMKSNCEQITIQYPDEWVKAETKERKYFFEQLEKQGEQPINNVESKFKVGDWVVTDYGRVSRVVSVDKYGDGYTLDDGVYFSGSWCNMYHHWTINDAKDGDVLAYVTDEENLWIMIYRSLYEPYEGHVHYHALLVNDNFSDKGTCCICIDNLKPATKEQRDLLFKKMENAGYMWDSKKKELKKIEPKTLNANKVVEWLDEHVPTKFEDMQNYVNQFKKDFEI